MKTLIDRPWEISFEQECSEEDIYYCFRLLLGRNPSPGEWPGHRNLAGGSLAHVVSIYLSSREFKDRTWKGVADSEHVLVDLGHARMYVSPEDAAIGGAIFCKNFEPHVTQAVRDSLRPGMTFLDIGANIGYFSLLASSGVGSQGQVICFEPSPYNLKLLYLNAAINGRTNIRIYPFAAADHSSLVAYDSSGSNGMISPARADLSALLATTLVYTARIGDVLSDLDRLDVIKIDVEGAEHLALSGGANLLRKFRPTIFSEFSPPALQSVSRVSAETYLQLLLPDESYSLAIVELDGRLTPCGRDLGAVVRCFEQSGLDHIDIRAAPAGAAPGGWRRLLRPLRKLFP
jgi:FkbM family methyltransferase